MSALANQLFTSLTQEEFKLVLSVAFLDTTDVFGGSYDAGRYATPGMEGKTDKWVELFLRAARFLAFECKYEFKALVLREDGRVMSAGEVEPGNVAYVILLEAGGLPDIELALQTAIQMVEEGRVVLDAGPLRATLGKVRVDVAVTEALAKADPEMKELRQLRRQGIRELMREEKVH